MMPGFAGVLTNAQIGALASYVRKQFSQQPAWNDVSKAVNAKRQQTASRGSQ
jgi:mono/diheme cytochrome c family protein